MARSSSPLGQVLGRAREAARRRLAEARDDLRYRLRYVQQSVDPLRQADGPFPLRIVCLDVDHGDSTLLIFPTGRVALVDSAKEAWGRRRVIPFLRQHRIGEVHYYINTHLHEDHVGQRDRILREFLVKEVWDYTTFKAGDRLELEGTQLTILNAHDDAEDENDRSLAFRLELDGFVYTHDADLYADGQRRILERFPDLSPSHVWRANHHLHGSVSTRYIEAVDPVVVVVSAQEAVYQRVAYTRDFVQVVRRLRQGPGRLRDVCLTLERGNVVIGARDGEHWGWWCYRPHIVLAGLYP